MLQMLELKIYVTAFIIHVCYVLQKLFYKCCSHVYSCTTQFLTLVVTTLKLGFAVSLNKEIKIK